MTSIFEETTINRIWLELSVILSLLIAFMSSQPASANGNGIAFETIVIQAEAQQVDIDGDGRFETFSADYTVYDDGTAEGVVYIDDEQIDIIKGEFGLTDDNTVSVSVMAVHELGHTIGFRHNIQHANSGDSTNCDGCDCIFWDIDGASVAQTFQVSVQFYFR